MDCERRLDFRLSPPGLREPCGDPQGGKLHAVIYPVRASYARKDGFKRDVTWNDYLFKDDFGGWSAQSNATPGNVESQPY